MEISRDTTVPYDSNDDAGMQTSERDGTARGVHGDANGLGSCQNNGRFAQETSMWVGDLDGYMDEDFLRKAVNSCGWGNQIARIKVVTRNHGTRTHAGYAFFDCVSEEAARTIMETGNGTPIPGTTRIWRLNLGKEGPQRSGIEANVYVGDVAPSVTDFALMQLFKAKYPSVRHAKVVCDDNGNPKGYAFVRFGSAQESERAVSEMDGFELEGKKVHLNLANRPKPSRGERRNASNYGSSRGGGAGGSGKRPRNPIAPEDPNNTTLFLGGTGPYLQEADLWREFSAFGELIAVRLPVQRKGFAFVRFRTRESAMTAKNALSGQHVASLNNAKPIRIEWATEQIEPQVNPMQYQFALPAMYGFMPAATQLTGFPAQAQLLPSYPYQYISSNTQAPAAKRQAPNERTMEGENGQGEYSPSRIVNS
mmetsp:Transcript_19152/g.76736  ORF Transcript_19152/g.76736 Transcript_19152/m.76736 type:complete len:423 (-) Transcript_19152:106-1374(-)